MIFIPNVCLYYIWKSAELNSQLAKGPRVRLKARIRLLMLVKWRPLQSSFNSHLYCFRATTLLTITKSLQESLSISKVFRIPGARARRALTICSLLLGRYRWGIGFLGTGISTGIETLPLPGFYNWSMRITMRLFICSFKINWSFSLYLLICLVDYLLYNKGL